jgi:hypothetical protein
MVEWIVLNLTVDFVMLAGMLGIAFIVILGIGVQEWSRKL